MGKESMEGGRKPWGVGRSGAVLGKTNTSFTSLSLLLFAVFAAGRHCGGEKQQTHLGAESMLKEDKVWTSMQ